ERARRQDRYLVSTLDSKCLLSTTITKNQSVLRMPPPLCCFLCTAAGAFMLFARGIPATTTRGDCEMSTTATAYNVPQPRSIQMPSTEHGGYKGMNIDLLFRHCVEEICVAGVDVDVGRICHSGEKLRSGEMLWTSVSGQERVKWGRMIFHARLRLGIQIPGVRVASACKGQSVQQLVQRSDGRRDTPAQIIVKFKFVCESEAKDTHESYSVFTNCRGRGNVNP
ncbi:hypothetical protein R3P38DRAFT_3539977, partial [Favolaschia claudopus]